jgi:hypothetical protein
MREKPKRYNSFGDEFSCIEDLCDTTAAITLHGRFGILISLKKGFIDIVDDSAEGKLQQMEDAYDRAVYDMEYRYRSLYH